MQKNVLILVGSPKIARSASDFIAECAEDSFIEKGASTRKEYIYQLFNKDGGEEILLSALDHCDIIIFSCPLYIDCLPYLMIKAMSLIVEHRKKLKEKKPQKLFVISNGGYPEAEQNYTALEIYKEFSSEADLEWCGGMAVGMGPIMSVRLFQRLKFLFIKFKEQIRSMISSCIDNTEFTSAKPLVPLWLYFWGARTAPWVLAGKNFVWRLYNRPYE